MSKCLKKLIASCLFLLLSLVPARAEPIVLTGGEAFLNSPYGKWLEAIYKEAFLRLGYDFELRPYPSQRAIVLGDTGAVDGQVERGHDFNVAHPNLVRVEEPTNVEAYSAWAAKPGVRLEGWESLRGTTYVVVARQGVGKTNRDLAKLVDPKNLHFVQQVEQGFRLVAGGRADLYIDYAPLAEEKLSLILAQSPDQYSKIYKAGDMERTSHHAFLHIRHKALAPKLAAVLKQMKQEGVLRKYQERFLVN